VDEVVTSREVGIEKPDPRIFSLALQRLGLIPPERHASLALHLGDHLQNDYHAPRVCSLFFLNPTPSDVFFLGGLQSGVWNAIEVACEGFLGSREDQESWHCSLLRCDIFSL
jgi:FMN phosphatase YigB (HAD superfamily)